MMNLFLSTAGQYDTQRMLIGLLVGVVVLILLVTMTKVHAFVALILSAMLVALVGGVPGGEIPGIITSGFGGTLGSIGIIIGFGVIMGQIFEMSGAAERMARTFIKLFGKGREELALAVTGFIVSIPIFCDSAFVILFPIAKAISQKTRKNLVVLAGALAMGLVITHTMVPPTPGPLAVAEAFGVGVGTMLIWGLIVAIPMTVAGIFYIKWVGRNLNITPDQDGNLIRLAVADKEIGTFELGEQTRELPSVFMSFAPILVPIALIVINQIVKMFDVSEGLLQALAFIGHPVVAVAIGVLISIYGLALKVSKEKVLGDMDAGIRSAGIILLVTGGGGALGKVIQVTGVGNVIAEKIADWGIPAILVPFVIATIVRFIQGSGTVSLVTSASISAPILVNLDVSPVFAALAAMVGGVFFGYFNDSYFHVVNRSIGIKNSKEQLKFWSGATTAAWAAGIITILILNALLGGVIR
jgi:gluconate:H+ symporter, GntP family